MNSVRYASIYKEFSRHLQTTPAAPANEASRHLIDGRSHPSLTKEGSSHTHNSFTRSDALGYDLFAASRLIPNSMNYCTTSVTVVEWTRLPLVPLIVNA